LPELFFQTKKFQNFFSKIIFSQKIFLKKIQKIYFSKNFKKNSQEFLK